MRGSLLAVALEALETGLGKAREVAGRCDLAHKEAAKAAGAQDVLLALELEAARRRPARERRAVAITLVIESAHKYATDR